MSPLLFHVDAMVLRDRDTEIDGTLNERIYAIQDAQFNVTALYDTYAGLVEGYLYDPYGNRTGETSVNWNYFFQGGRFDAGTGLGNFRNRDYSPTLGRWIEQDPLGYPDGADRYQFEMSNPANDLDPSGLMPNQADAIDIDALVYKIKSVEKGMKNPQDANATMRYISSHFLGQKTNRNWWKYIYLENNDWLDIPHFFKSALGEQDYGALQTMVAGVLTEQLQSFAKDVYRAGLHNRWLAANGSSAFTPEDIPSDLKGIGFGAYVQAHPNQYLHVLVRDFLTDSGATTLTSPTLASNFKVLPPSEKAWQKERMTNPKMANWRMKAYYNPSLPPPTSTPSGPGPIFAPAYPY